MQKTQLKIASVISSWIHWLNKCNLESLLEETELLLKLIFPIYWLNQIGPAFEATTLH